MLTSGTATPVVDYPALPWLVRIPAGAASLEIRIQPVDDDANEGIETVVATLSNCPPDTDPPLGAPCYGFDIDPLHASATVFIRDDGLTQASVAITAPESGAKFSPREPIQIEAIAIDLEGYIPEVSFWDGDQLIGISEINFIRPPDPGTPIRHTIEWTDAAIGRHVLTARVRRIDGVVIISVHGAGRSL